MRLHFFLLSTLLICGVGRANDLDQLIGNSYENSDRDAPPDHCRASFNSSVRTLHLQPGKQGTVVGKLIVTTDRQASAARYSMPRDLREECEDWSENAKAHSEIEFDISKGTFRSTVIDHTNSSNKGSRYDGNFSVLNEGRSILLHYSDEGVRRVYAVKGSVKVATRAAGTVTPEGGLVMPQNPPDITLNCRAVSVADRTSSSSSQSSFGSDRTRSSNSQFSSSSSSTSNSSSSTFGSNSSCADSNWQARRVSFSIWLGAQICNTSKCEITDRGFKWSGGYVDRLTGQYEDGCFLYSCEKSSVGQRKF
jgi:hypothetical protein